MSSFLRKISKGNFTEEEAEAIRELGWSFSSDSDNPLLLIFYDSYSQD